nr:hypothetical protein CFP56_74883 [Quercus suber]
MDPPAGEEGTKDGQPRMPHWTTARRANSIAPARVDTRAIIMADKACLQPRSMKLTSTTPAGEWSNHDGVKGSCCCDKPALQDVQFPSGPAQDRWRVRLYQRKLERQISAWKHSAHKTETYWEVFENRTLL